MGGITLMGQAAVDLPPMRLRIGPKFLYSSIFGALTV
jgi:hypothetical protein